MNQDSTPQLFLGRFTDSVLMGFLLALLVHALSIGLLFSQQWVMGVVLIGVAQLVWLVPLRIYLMGRGLKAMGKGVLIVGGLTLLVNTTCFALVMTDGGFRH